MDSSNNIKVICCFCGSAVLLLHLLSPHPSITFNCYSTGHVTLDSTVWILYASVKGQPVKVDLGLKNSYTRTVSAFLVFSTANVPLPAGMAGDGTVESPYRMQTSVKN